MRRTFHSPVNKINYAIITNVFKDGVQGRSGIYFRIVTVQEDKVIIRIDDEIGGVPDSIFFTDDMRLSDILFAPDIKKWEEIKNMRYGDYIHQQLEPKIPARLYTG